MSAEKENSVSIKEAAEIMGCTQQFLRVGLQRGIFAFGVAIQLTAKKYTYYVNRHQLMEYLGEAK